MSSDYTDDDTLTNIPVLDVDTYDESSDEDELVGKPPDYFERRHRKWIYKRVPPIVTIGVLGSGAALTLLPASAGLIAALLIAAITAYVSLRYMAEYRLRPIRLSVASGALVISQAGGKVWPWFLSSSSREIFPLDLYRPETPELTPAERLVFRNCGTLEIKTLDGEKAAMPPIKDVKNPQHIVDIFEWRLNDEARRQAAQSRAAEQTPALLQELCDRMDRSNELHERTNELLETMLTVLKPPKPQPAPRKRATPPH